LEDGAERNVDPSLEIAGAEHVPLGIDVARHADAQRFQGGAAAGKTVDLLVENAQDGAHAVAGGRLDLVGVDVEVAPRLPRDDRDLGAADVDAEQVAPLHSATWRLLPRLAPG